MVTGEVLVEQPESRSDLGERDPERLHAAESSAAMMTSPTPRC
jgi:hypothetical protein